MLVSWHGVNYMPTHHPFLEWLRQGPILCDGGMGTGIYVRDVFYERRFEQVRFTRFSGDPKHSG